MNVNDPLPTELLLMVGDPGASTLAVFAVTLDELAEYPPPLPDFTEKVYVVFFTNGPTAKEVAEEDASYVFEINVAGEYVNVVFIIVDDPMYG